MKSKVKFIILSEDKNISNEILNTLNSLYEGGFSSKNGFVLTSQNFINPSEETITNIEKTVRDKNITYSISWFSDSSSEMGLDVHDCKEGKYNTSSVSQSLSSDEISEFDFFLLLGKKDYVERVFYGV